MASESQILYHGKVIRDLGPPSIFRGFCCWFLDVYIRYLGGGNSNIVYFHLYLGKIPILTIIFFKWVVQPPTRYASQLLQALVHHKKVCFKK